MVEQTVVKTAVRKVAQTVVSSVDQWAATMAETMVDSTAVHLAG
jgi:peptide deformylase